jgi:bifunctional non-homologous end joining protein LigD
MTLAKYKEKRNFKVTPEPSGDESAKKAAHKNLLYVIQKHRATQLHYDFRLEFEGVLLSWAVPKGPSLDPGTKRLAMQVEDHPVDYGGFEGVIPEGEYGGGTVMVWDTGTWTPESPDIAEALKKGDLKFQLHGKKLRGSWVLVRTRGFGSSSGKSWLLIKHRDKFASTEDIATTQPKSAVSNRLLADIARDAGGDAEKAATGDPKPEVKAAGRKAPAKKASSKRASPSANSKRRQR